MKGQIHFYKDNEVKKKLPLNRLTYNEEAIIALSESKYNDSEPCIRIRTHVIMELCMNLINEFPKAKVNKILSINDFIEDSEDYICKNSFKSYCKKNSFNKIKVI